MDHEKAAIGIIGGSGLYQIEGFSNPQEHRIDTPFGAPSDAIVGGEVAGRRVFFLPRHGRGHRILPHELNHRANIYALRSLGVRWIICVTAVGSLQEKYAPARHRFAFAVLRPDQPAGSAHFFRRTELPRTSALQTPSALRCATCSRKRLVRSGVHSPQRRHLREHGWPGLFHPRRIGVESPPRLRRHRHDQPARGEAGPRSRDRPRHAWR